MIAGENRGMARDACSRSTATWTSRGLPGESALLALLQHCDFCGSCIRVESINIRIPVISAYGCIESCGFLGSRFGVAAWILSRWNTVRYQNQDNGQRFRIGFLISLVSLDFPYVQVYPVFLSFGLACSSYA
jgi:hypothetical protein